MTKTLLCWQYWLRSLRAGLTACVLSLLALNPVWADDTEIYYNSVYGSSVKPNMLFVLDASISMNNKDGGTTTRLKRMVTAMNDVLDGLSDDYNVGLMRFGGMDGGRILYPIRDLAEPGVRDDLKAALGDIVSVLATPTVGALEEMYLYFSGGAVKHGLKRPLTAPNRSTKNTALADLTRERYSRVSHPDSHDGDVIQPVGCDDTDLNSAACAEEYVVEGANYGSPILSECQSNYAILLSDGNPWVGWNGKALLADTYNETIVQGKLLSENGSCKDVGIPGQCGEEFARAMNTIDLMPGTEFPGNQTVTTHSIGFNIKSDWIKNIAIAGGGTYYEAESSNDLIDALLGFISTVSESGTTVVAPSATIDQFTRLSHREEVYLALFKPTASASWVGNLKKYKFAGVSPTLKDQLGTDAIDATTGEFIPTSKSFWSAAPDGADVLMGGAASKLLLANRRVVTNVDVDTNKSLIGLLAPDTNPNEIHQDNDLVTDAMLGVADAPVSAVAGQACFFDRADWSYTGTRGSGFRACGTAKGLVNFGAAKGHRNSISAISVGSGVNVTIYDGTGGAGDSLCIDEDTDINSLGDMSDRASSFKVAAGECPSGLPVVVVPEREVLLSWLKGVDVKDDDDDQDTTDARNHIGDPLHSSPVVVTYGVEQGETLDKDNLNSLVFFGTNEGFLHAIDTVTGVEEYAFMPKELLPNVLTLFADNTVGRNEVRPYGVDGDITLRTIDVNNNGLIESADGDKAYLYVGLRRGGRNYYALDVSVKDQPEFMWDIIGGTGDYAELGQSWSKPILTKVKIDDDLEDVLVFAGGYDPQQDDVDQRTADSMGRALYIVDADTGALIWSGGNPASLPISNKHYGFAGMSYSMPANLSVVNDQATGLMSQIYVGDMGGQLWRFDVNNGSAIAGLVDGGVIADFAADASAADARRFYGSPDLSLSKDDSGLVMNIAIGSGYRAHPLETAVEDKFFVLQYPYDGYGADYGVSVNSVYSPATLLNLYDATDNTIAEGLDADIEIAKAALDSAEGWFITLEDSGEKVLDQSSTFQGVVRFVSYVPAVPIGPCDPSLGTSYYYAVNLSDGTPFEDLNPDETDPHSKEFRRKEIPTPGIAPPVSTIFVKNEDNGSTTITPTDVSGVNTIYQWGDVSDPVRWFWAEVPE